MSIANKPGVVIGSSELATYLPSSAEGSPLLRHEGRFKLLQNEAKVGSKESINKHKSTTSVAASVANTIKVKVTHRSSKHNVLNHGDSRSNMSPYT